MCTDRRGYERTPQSQHSWTLSGCGDELERLTGAEETCSLSEDLGLLPERDGVAGGGEVSVKGWSRWVSCVDSSVGV